MTKTELRAGVYGHIANADSLPLPVIDQAIMHGVWSVFRRARNTRHFQQVREKFLPIVADQDELDLGADVETVVRVFRQDQSGARAFPVNPQLEEEADRISDEMPSYSYIPLANNRIRLLEIPLTSSTGDHSADGLRLLYRPRPVKLVADDQEPDLPEATHENVVAEAVARLSLTEGATIANPDRFERFRARLSKELDLYLTPSLEDSTQVPPDSWGFYDTEGSI